MPNQPSSNLTSQSLSVEKHMRAKLKNQQPMCIWLTGLSGAGKSELANALELRLHHMGHHTYLLDGDNVRLGINSDLGFSDADRAENIRRVAELARLMVDAGLIVITAFISPFRADRALARALFQPNEFLEVYVDTPLDECIRRDPKGLYEKALNGSLQNFTGVGSRYEPPESPDIHIQTSSCTPVQAADRIISALMA